MFQRRHLLQLGAAALAAPALAAPRIAQATSQRVLKFVPQSDLTVLDPVWTTATVTRNHAFLVFDTLYGLDTDFRPHPQMAEGHVVEADGRAWNIRLRPGLMFHDGTPVLARDCVASLQRWGRRDAFGQSLMAVTEAPDDQPSAASTAAAVSDQGTGWKPSRISASRAARCSGFSISARAATVAPVALSGSR